MQELNRWTEATVIYPLQKVARGDEFFDQEMVEEIKKAIRTKVLESYRNGQKAGPKATLQRPMKGGR